MDFTRLSDRIEKEKDGSEVKVKRFGLWGTNVEIEVKGKLIEVVYPKGKREKFKKLEEAKQCLEEIVNGRRKPL